MPVGSAALSLALGLALYLLYHGSLTRTIWLGLNILDTLRALRVVRPNGRAVGQVTRRKAMRQALITWIVYVAGQSVGSVPDRLLGWLPLYDTVKIIVLCGFLATRVISSTSIYRSLLVPLLRKYQTPIDLSLLLIHSILALGVHYLLWIPLDVVRSVYRRAVVLSGGVFGTFRPVLGLVSVPLTRRRWRRERTNETEMGVKVEVGVGMETQRPRDGDGDASAGDGSAGTAPEQGNVNDEALLWWLTPGPAIPGRLVRSVQPSFPIARTDSESERNLDDGEARDQIPKQARGVTTVSAVSVQVDGSSHAGPSTLASTPNRPKTGGSTLAVPVVPTLRRSPRLRRTQAAQIGRQGDTDSAQVDHTLAERSNVVHMFRAGDDPDPSAEDSGGVAKPVPKSIRPLQVGKTRSQPAPRVPSLKSVNVAHNHSSRSPTLPDPKHPALFSAMPPTSKESVLGSGNGKDKGNGNGKAQDPPARMNRGKGKIGVASRSMTLGGALQEHSAPTRAPQGLATRGKGPGPGPGPGPGLVAGPAPQRSNSVMLPLRPPRSTTNTTSTKLYHHPPIFNPGPTKDEPPAQSTSATRVPLPPVPPTRQMQSRYDPPPARSQAPTNVVTAKVRSVRPATRSIVISDDVPRGGVAVRSAARVRASREATKRGVGGVSNADKDTDIVVPGKRVAERSGDERERRKRLRVGV